MDPLRQVLKVLGVEDLVEKGEMKGQHEGETVLLSLLREIRGYLNLKILCEQSLEKSPKADTGSNCGSERGDAIMDDNTDTKTYVDVAVNGLTLSASGKDTNGGTNETTSTTVRGTMEQIMVLQPKSNPFKGFKGRSMGKKEAKSHWQRRKEGRHRTPWHPLRSFSLECHSAT